MVPLNYNQLYYFYKIAELGSMALASKTILISSPALSMQLKELEESLGTPLFARVGKKLVLTEAGSIVFEYARDIFKLGHELKDTIGDRATSKERLRIEIGCQDSIPKNIADDLVTFLIEQKNCKVVLREGNREQLLRMQSEFKLDLILTNSVPAVDNSFIYETKLLLEEELIVVGHPKYKALQKKFPQSLEGKTFIFPTFDSSLRQKLDTYSKKQNLHLDIVAEVEDKATEVDLALKGHGLVFALRASVSSYLKSGELVELGKISSVKEEIWMIIGKRKILNPIALFAMKNFSFKHR
jgi:LysR family transcriptional activator of nhaA